MRLGFLVKNCAISEELHQRMLAWRHAAVETGGFRDPSGEDFRAPDPVVRSAPAEQMLRAPNIMKRAMRWHDFGSGREERPAA